MLRRAEILLALALLAAAFGFTGILLADGALLARIFFFIFSALAALSLLFSLFEEASPPRDRADPAWKRWDWRRH
jgi:uncharacterized membrane protein YtjA (UPF0391 family)